MRAASSRTRAPRRPRAARRDRPTPGDSRTPAPPVLGRGLPRSRSPFGAGMRPRVRKGTEGDHQPRTECLAEAREHRAETTAIRTQEVAVEDDADHAFGGVAAAHVIATGIDRTE